MNFDITVSGEDFDKALKQIMKFNKGRKPFDLTLEYDGTSLLLVTTPVTIPIPATGSADVKIVLPGKSITGLRGLFPAILRFTLNGNALKIDRLTMPCTVTG
jgi:hypothetical protein